MQVDRSGWSGEGSFTQVLVEQLARMTTVGLIRVEDAPASRSEADYNFISNEIYVGFSSTPREERVRRLVVFPARRVVLTPDMTFEGLERTLTALPEVGAPDYSDGGMLQYLRTERIVPSYQTRGYKLVEMVRIYESRQADSAVS
jgi:hypothetical protein